MLRSPHPSLHVQRFGLSFAHPLGLAAGFDKNAVAIAPLLACGFASVEIGTVTPQPQAGNPKPRLFRLKEDRAVINRLGFPGEGEAAIMPRLAQWQARRKKPGVVGVNIGKNKDSADAVDDYVHMLKAAAPYADYVAINISSPNTPGLRDLQSKDALNQLLQTLMETRQTLSRRVPLLLKIAPDLDQSELEGIAATALAYTIDGLIVSNTTIARPEHLKSNYASEIGGLSGAPLFAPSTEALRTLYKMTGGHIPLIGVGGVASAEDAYAKIRAGASLVQCYSALVYEGFGLIQRIVRGLPHLLARDGFSSVNDAVGVDAR